MSAMLPRAKLAAVLGMIGSDNDHECLAAARIAESIRRQMGATWDELLAVPNPLVPRPRPHDWRAIVAQSLARPEALGPWELQFPQSLQDFPRLSPKQAACLRRIAERVFGEDAA